MQKTVSVEKKMLTRTNLALTSLTVHKGHLQLARGDFSESNQSKKFRAQKINVLNLYARHEIPMLNGITWLHTTDNCA